ncbi:MULTISPECIES: YejG family protein [Pantoea]|jgi:hypothetical protein|uniref:YejG-like protein n=1 Tax=Pantoea piersonii TaxID=2364647 RepID=A0AAJ5UAU2_9GAMM|nr:MULTISPECIES: hypothetical protein [Pantoea]MDU6432319.1 hypothetical protein [Pantoea sp.]MBZ6385053.1 hypothetical protein [Pantoea piersonii]MBZ6402072.1 hypothetical protein [Pantoea piersonii]MBZ6409418.1 hypothetical protein [Pantoea piersonii]MBZ6428907.1 hypothetical protein [Pantoea piersonii]
MLQLSIVHRLPQRFRWASELHSAIVAEEGVANEQDLIALRLISHDGHLGWEIMHQLQDALASIQVECKVAECEGSPCLFILRSDESATNCCLKNQGVAIAETFNGH